MLPPFFNRDAGHDQHYGSHADQAIHYTGGQALRSDLSCTRLLSEPVTRGTRLASFFWIESLVRSDEQRTLLHDMDLALTLLRERDGESAEAVALTGAYHSLPRQWADTRAP